jgi:hypothetical protein
MTAAEMEQIIESARQRSRTMTRADLEQQARSFAAGNAGIEDPRITRKLVDFVADSHLRPRR